jgi:hypothetical protein
MWSQNQLELSIEGATSENPELASCPIQPYQLLVRASKNYKGAPTLLLAFGFLTCLDFRLLDLQPSQNLERRPVVHGRSTNQQVHITGDKLSFCGAGAIRPEGPAIRAPLGGGRRQAIGLKEREGYAAKYFRGPVPGVDAMSKGPQGWGVQCEDRLPCYKILIYKELDLPLLPSTMSSNNRGDLKTSLWW